MSNYATGNYTKQERKKNVKIEYKKDVLSRDQH
jgi:hypothetical protein